MDGQLVRLRSPLSAGLAGLALCAAAGGTAAVGASAGSDPYSFLPDQIVLTGTVRDFRARDQTGGHADFQRRPSDGFGVYAYMVADELDGDGKPVMATTGHRVTSPWLDDEGRPRMPPRPHLPMQPGDTEGSMRAEGGALTSSSDFAQWYRDTPGVNVSALQDIRLEREPGTNVYVFDDRQDPEFDGLGGFFPINNTLFGNYANTQKNFHFTYELSTEFTYEANSEQVFRFIGDDDVWVFIDGKCVIDLGGVHGAAEQTIELDRLDWLQSGEDYTLQFFFAERHTTQSNFRIETTLRLRTFDSTVTVSMPFD